MRTIYDFSVKDRKGGIVSLKEYANEVILIVNTATKCGFTPQYEELEKLYERHHSEGFTILDFPCNQFNQQAPGTDESIHQFCKLTYGTEFPRFKKVKVNGKDADPLFVYLKEQKGFEGFDMKHPIAGILDNLLAGEAGVAQDLVALNLGLAQQLLINKRGQVVARFEPTENFEVIEQKIIELLK